VTAFGSVDELQVGLGVWVRARGWWRRGVVVHRLRARAVVAFRLASTPRTVCQRVPLYDLRPYEWQPPLLLSLSVEAPSIDEARAVAMRMP